MSANGHLVKVCTDRIASMGSNDADTEEDFAEDLEMLERANIVDGFSYLMGDSPPAVNPPDLPPDGVSDGVKVAVKPKNLNMVHLKHPFL